MSELECLYYRYLLDNPSNTCILYKLTPVYWQNGFDGSEHTHYPSFTINGVEHVDVIYPRLPLTKYLYAQNNLDGWRMISDTELRILGIIAKERIKWWN